MDQYCQGIDFNSVRAHKQPTEIYGYSTQYNVSLRRTVIKAVTEDTLVIRVIRYELLYFHTL